MHPWSCVQADTGAARKDVCSEVVIHKQNAAMFCFRTSCAALAALHQFIHYPCHALAARLSVRVILLLSIRGCHGDSVWVVQDHVEV